MNTFLIMAGGSGERFWPLSTKEKPKQLLKIFNNKSLIRLTFERILPLTSIDNIFIATNEIQAGALKEELPEVDESRIIIEPLFRETASAISYGSMIINKYIKNANICVLASDHLITDENNFRSTLLKAFEESSKGNIVTLGIKPTAPETCYGYIHVRKIEVGVPTKALDFKEKPKKELAIEYFDSNKYLWNSGIFIFKYSTILNALKKYSPNHYEICIKLDKIIKQNEGVKTARMIYDDFKCFEKKSIDYAVMEYAKNILVIPSSFGWDDVGSYLAFEELFSSDNNGNTIKGVNAVTIDSNNNIIVSDCDVQKVSLLGVSNMIIAVTKNNILICEKSNNQDIKRLINMH